MAKALVAVPIPHSERPDYNQRALPQYVRALEAAGLTAVPIPYDARPDEIARLVGNCQGVLLPGSPADVDPQKYGADRDPLCNAADPRRDTVDELLLQDAHNMHKPILAVCYGLQSLNVWRTGSLIQHLQTGVDHEPGAEITVAHEVEIKADTLLAKALGTVKEATHTGGKLLLPVNSSHHQAVLAIGDGLCVAAVCPRDGVVEALEGTSTLHWVCAVQWHPERLADEASTVLFAAFSAAVASWTPRSITESVG